MNKYFLIIGLAAFLVKSNAQNTFPSSGKTGIGTSSPSAYLDVMGSETSNWLSIFNNSSAYGHKMYFGYSNAVNSTLGLLITGGRGLYNQYDFAVENKFYVNGNGNVRIGNTSPDYGKVLIAGNISKNSGGITSDNSILHLTTNENDYPFGLKLFLVGSDNPASRYAMFQTGDHNISNQGNIALQPAGGNVGIGTSSPSERLSVNGNIRAKKVIVSQSGWSDYVFDDNYQLKPLSELAKFIKQNKHLPDIPSAKEVEEKGISVGDNQALLLKKIEEITLYLIELKKENEQQQQLIDQLLKAQNKIK
jgi:hypothetical protein